MSSMRSIIVLILAVMLLGACAPTPGSPLGTETAIAAKIYATLTALAPTITPEPTITPVPPATPTTTPSPTALPQAKVLSSVLNLRDGPSINFASIGTVKGDDLVTLLGEYQQCQWLKIQTAAGKTGWLKGGNGFLKLPVDCTLIPHGTYRPFTGTILLDLRQGQGKGRLIIDNNSSSDGLVVLVDTIQKPFLAVYVRSMEKFTIINLTDGTYQVFFTLGTDWDGENRKFQKVDQVKKLDNGLAYTTAGATGTSWTIMLNTQVSGAASASEIPPAQFPVFK